MPRFHYASRLNSFKARPDLFTWRYSPGDVRDLLHRVSLTPGLDRIGLNFPEHFNKLQLNEIKTTLAEIGLPVDALNLRYPESEYLNGAFTNPELAVRQSAIRLTQEAVDYCRELGTAHIVLWLGNDGFDYPFQVDYERLWTWELEGIRAVADYAPELKISIEYKPSEPRRFSLLPDIGTTLLAIHECQKPNLGVTLDFCHMLMARENPATSAALCLRQNRLYGLHMNDGYWTLDDGLMIGSVNLFQTIELLYHVIRSDYEEMIYFDTFPLREDPVQECASNIRRTNQIVELIENLDTDKLFGFFSQQDALGASGQIWEAIFKR